jgi:hypothetical protein
MVLVLWTKGLAIVVVSVATEYLDLLRQLCIFFTAGFGLLWIWRWALDEPTPPDETRLPVHAAGQHHSLGAGVAGNDVARVAR